MRTLVVFGILCAALFVGVAWRIATSSTAAPSEATSAQLPPSALPEAEIAPSSETPAASIATESPTTVAAEEPPPTAKPEVAARGVAAATQPSVPSTTAVRWPAAEDRADQEHVLKAARAVLANDPNHRRALRDEYAALSALGRTAEATEVLARLAGLEPHDQEVQLQYAEQLLQNARWVTATEVLEDIVRQSPKEAQAWRYLAVAQQSLGRLSDAQQSWDQVLSIVPDDATALASRGTLRQKLQDWEGAERDFERAASVNPDDITSILSRSIALAHLSRTAEAEQIVGAVLVTHPDCVPALNRLAELNWLLIPAPAPADSFRRTRTIQLCRKSLGLDPNQPVIQELLKQAEAAPSSPTP